MRIKKIIIDKASRLLKMPPDILSFPRVSQKRSLVSKDELLDLAGFEWPLRFTEDQTPTADELCPATATQLDALKEELAKLYEQQHQVKLVPSKEILVGGRISSLLLTLSLAYVENGDIAFVPELGLPLYRKVVTACGGEPISYRISPKNDWLPDFERIGTRLGRVARFLFLNSPHNPTGTELGEKEMTALVWLADRENLLVINDAAYQSTSGRKPISLLSAKGGKKVGIECGSFSYHFGLPHLPFGFVVGNREIISGMKLAAGLNPSWIPAYFVEMSLRAIRRYPDQPLREVRDFVSESSNAAGAMLKLLDCERFGTSTVPFIWARTPQRSNGTKLSRLLYQRYRLLTAPGSDFGNPGDGFLRLSLTAPAERYTEAARRLRKKPRLLGGTSKK
jgi:LL-diaminopimelate aminotransferase